MRSPNFKKSKLEKRQFWVVLFVVWAGFGVINFLFRWQNQIDTFEVGLISCVFLVVINVISCALMAVFIKQPWAENFSSWRLIILILLVSALLSVLSTMLLLFTLSTYLYLRGFVPEISVEIGSISGNALIVFLLMLFWVVSESLLTFIKKNKALKKEQQQTLLELKDAQLNLLSGQLNPHFLFNGLNNIRSLILEDKHMAREMVTALAEILRYGLNSHKENWVSLKSEMAMVQNYIALAKIQYEDRLVYREHVAPDLDSVEVPPMMIQLLVENAIRHGIDHCVVGGELSVNITTSNTEEIQKLLIEVNNPGTLQSKLKRDFKSTGLGILNIEKRLQLLFGGNALFKLEECQGQVNAKLLMPIKRSKS